MIGHAGEETEHNGAEHVAHVQPAESGQICIAAGPGWSYWWPRGEWDQLDQAGRQGAIMRAIHTAEGRALEDDHGGLRLAAWSELVDLNPPAWREWGGIGKWIAFSIAVIQ